MGEYPFLSSVIASWCVVLATRNFWSDITNLSPRTSKRLHNSSTLTRRFPTPCACGLGPRSCVDVFQSNYGQRTPSDQVPSSISWSEVWPWCVSCVNNVANGMNGYFIKTSHIVKCLRDTHSEIRLKKLRERLRVLDAVFLSARNLGGWSCANLQAVIRCLKGVHVFDRI
jgi:hypothetical protein